MTMATTATFSASSGVLAEFGDTADNSIVTSQNGVGRILVNNGVVPIIGATPTIANTTLIQVFGQNGNDTIALDEANGALPMAQLFGGDGNDTLTGGSGGDLLFGQAGADTLFGKGGNDFLFGGDGKDILTGGPGDDQVFGQAGNDIMIWNPGDGSDTFEGGDGSDIALVNGGNGAETFTITANGTRVRLDRVNPAPFTLDIGTTESLVLHAGGGDDVITAGNGLSSLISLTLDGGDGNDTITGGDGADQVIGGAGNDVIAGGRGNDTASLGDGDDTFVWNPGDGSDTVFGGAGSDTLDFNGANVAEKINISANGAGFTFTRDVANITMSVSQVETIEFTARGGADLVTIGDLTGTGVSKVNVDLSATGGGSPLGDGAADNVIVNGTGKNDALNITGAGTAVSVTGLPAAVNINGAEGANDRLTVNGGVGNDTINAATLPAGIIGLTIDGGAGNDTITGSQGADTLIGGDDNDSVIGGRGDDVAFLGAGDDSFSWNPGDGSDTIEGQAGVDALLFNGSNAGENFDISANGGRVRLFRDVGNVTMDLNGMEHIQLATVGGADSITVNDLTGTGVTQVSVNLAASGGGGDNQADSVVVNGTAVQDTISVVSSASSVVVNGLVAQTIVSGMDATLDKLTVNGLGGDDVINASGLNAGRIILTINGGDGADTITGSAGDDIVVGGRGNDTALLGGGNDTYVWNPGDGSDTVEGQAGTDTLQFNGANVNERIEISANGSRARLTRDVANITMDLNSIETINVSALGGADTLTVDDLTGTGVRNVNLDLSSPAGSGTGDGQADTIVINATNGADNISVSSVGGVITVSGLAATVTITGAEAANDRLVINGLGGDDVIDATGLAAGHIQLTADGGIGNDLLIGSPGADTLLGGADDDILIGGGGLDILNGGSGNNVLIPSAVMAQTLLSRPTGFATTAVHSLSALSNPHASSAGLTLVAYPHA
jgi:Ca2+-binding RTX toxin-like protein